MSDARQPFMMLRLNAGEKGLVDSMRRYLDGRPLAPIVRETVLELARRVTTNDKEHADE